MKKSIVVLSALVLFAGVSFGQDKTAAAPAKTDKTAKTTKKDTKKGDKKADKKDAKATAPAAK